MKRILLVVGALMFSTSLAMADDLVPATSDDTANFDNQIPAPAPAPAPSTDADGKHGKSADHSKDKKPKSNFGTTVSAEAKKLKDADKDTRKGMGNWVSSQRRKDEQKRPNAAATAGAGASAAGSANSDARTSAPAGATNGSADGRGQSGTRGH